MRPGANGEARDPRAWTPRRLWPLLPIAAGLILFFASGMHHVLTFDELRARHGELQAAVRDHYALALLVFIGSYVVAVALSLPGVALLTIAGGFLFGPIVATVCVVVGATTGATLLFLAARTSLGTLLEAKAGPWMLRLEAGFRRDQWSYMFFLRLMPIFPFFGVNLAAGLLGVGFLCFVVATFIGIIPVTFVYALAGAGIGDAFDAGTTITLAGLLTPKLFVALICLAILAVLPAVFHLLRRRSSGA